MNHEQNQLSAEAQIEAAMRALEQSDPTILEHNKAEERMKIQSTSPTLDALDSTRHPKAKTACETCPNSVWFSSPAEVKCYCRVMFLITWSTKEPNQITDCDGVFLGQEH